MNSEKGLSLVELLIAMALGLILTLGVVQIFISSKQTYTVVTSQSQAQENGRIVKHFLGQALRHAGYWDDPTVPRHFPTHGSFSDDEVIRATDNDASEPAVLDNTDTLTIRFNGSADGTLSNCLGSVPEPDEFAVDRYYIGQPGGSTLVSGLICESRLIAADGTETMSTQPLIVGIENLQIELGLGDQAQVLRYVKPDLVTDWREVKSVRYAVLATSNQDSAGARNTLTYTLLGDESATAPGDRRMRQVQRETVYLRNFRGLN